MVGAHGSPRRPPLRPIRFHPAGAACRGEGAPRPYFLVAYPHVIDGLGAGAVLDAITFEASVIPAKAGIQCTRLRKCSLPNVRPPHRARPG
jgi:hypothetical protein